MVWCAVHRLIDVKRYSGTYYRSQSCLDRSSVGSLSTEQNLAKPQGVHGQVTQYGCNRIPLSSEQSQFSRLENRALPYALLSHVVPTVSVLHHNRCFIIEDLEAERDLPKAFHCEVEELRIKVSLFSIRCLSTYLR